MPPKQWRAKVVSKALRGDGIADVEEQKTTVTEAKVEAEANQSEGPATPVRSVGTEGHQDRFDTPIRPVAADSEQTETPTMSSLHNRSEVPVPEGGEEEIVDYEPSPAREYMDAIVIYLSSVDYSLVGDDEVSEMSFGLRDATFQKPKDSKNHLKPLYIWGHLDIKPISRMLVDGGAIINLMPYSPSLFKKMASQMKS
jgi:hypothetical protein